MLKIPYLRIGIWFLLFKGFEDEMLLEALFRVACTCVVTVCNWHVNLKSFAPEVTLQEQQKMGENHPPE